MAAVVLKKTHPALHYTTHLCRVMSKLQSYWWTSHQEETRRRAGCLSSVKKKKKKKKNTQTHCATFALVAVSLLDAAFFPVVGHAHSPRRVTHASLMMRWLTEWCLLCGNKRAWGYHMGWMGWHIRQSTFKSTADVYIRLVRQPWAAEMNGFFFVFFTPFFILFFLNITPCRLHRAFWLSAQLSARASPILCLIWSRLMYFVPSIA